MLEWTFDDGGIRFGDGGPGLGGFLSGSAQAVVAMHNAQVAGLQQQLAERDAALAQEHVLAGEAMAWVEFLREPLTAIIAASDAQEWEAWEKGMERARAALAECDPSKPGPARPRPLKEAEAALAGTRQALEALLDWGGWRHCECGWCLRCRVVKPALAADFGRDRLALERELAAELVLSLKGRDSYQVGCECHACSSLRALIERCQKAGLL